MSTPRAASALLVAGPMPATLWQAVLQIHDQLAGPRHTVVWGPAPFPPLPHAAVVLPEDDPVPALLGATDSPEEVHVLPDVDPNPWRGVGPYGQGGKGMTGGTPYGRPLPGRAPDRDGLELDQLPVAVGPFFPGLPPGLVLHVKFQGDVVQEAAVADNPFALEHLGVALEPSELGVFERALVEPVPIAELELSRARHHLWWLGDALALHGLGALGERSWRLAASGETPSPADVARLERAVRRSQVLRWAVGGDRPIPRSLLSERQLGPVARAGGHDEDSRRLDPEYRSLGFAPVLGHASDVAGRWRQRLAEIQQSLALASAAGDRRSTPVGVVESPRGAVSRGGPSPSAALLSLVGDAVAGLEWGDAVATIVSLDLDLEEASRPVGETLPA